MTCSSTSVQYYYTVTFKKIIQELFSLILKLIRSDIV